MPKIQPKNSLLERLHKNSTLDNVAVLAESNLFHKKDFIVTLVPGLNIALSGELEGGMPPGLLQIAGESKHFKTSFLLLMIKAFQDKYPDGVVIFYDSEFGAPQAYFEAFGVDMTRILHCPVTDIEMLKSDVARQLASISRSERVMIAIDSLGNLASRKEAEDAVEGKVVADMTRAKQLKSFFRIVTPHLTIKQLYMVVVNHVYKEIGLFPKTIVGGGTGSYLASDNIWIIGREQMKDGKELEGYQFNIRIEKSRYAKEKSVIPVKVTFDGGIEKYSGLLDIAVECGYIQRVQVKPAYYARVDTSTGEVLDEKLTEEDMDKDAFWSKIIEDETFKEFVRTKYKIAYSSMLGAYEPTVEENDEEGELEENGK
jgi:RecA/RadA recombinase